MTNQPGRQLLPSARRAADDWSLRYFAESYDALWRAAAVHGLLRLMQDRPGFAAALDADIGNGTGGWLDDDYVHGGLARGLVAAGVNEVAMYCEDLLALLHAVHVRQGTAKALTRTGNVTTAADRLANMSEQDVRRAFFVPPADVLGAGLAEAPEPAAAAAAAEDAVALLAARASEVAVWYRSHRGPHLSYRHGLRVLFRAFGKLPPETIEKRRGSTAAPLVTLTTAPPTSGLFLQAPEELFADLAGLVDEQLLPRIEFVHPEIDLASLAALALRIGDLQQLLLANCVAVLDGPDASGQQAVRLPHPVRGKHVTVRWRTGGATRGSYRVEI